VIFQSTIGRSNSPLKPAAVSFGSGVRERRATSELSQTRAYAGDARSRIATRKRMTVAAKKSCERVKVDL